jgi:hypothetical protein
VDRKKGRTIAGLLMIYSLSTEITYTQLIEWPGSTSTVQQKPVNLQPATRNPKVRATLDKDNAEASDSIIWGGIFNQLRQVDANGTTQDYEKPF